MLKFLLKSKFLGFVEAPVGVFLLLYQLVIDYDIDKVILET